VRQRGRIGEGQRGRGADLEKGREADFLSYFLLLTS